MTIIKICKKHGELSENDVRGGIYKGRKYIKCKQCETERSRIYSKKLYLDPDLVKIKHERDKARWENKKHEITLKRQQPDALEKRKEAYRKNIDKYRSFYKGKQKKYRDELHDTYIKKIIQNGNSLIRFDSISRQIVDLKRSLMILKKGIKTMKTNNMGETLDEDKKY